MSFRILHQRELRRLFRAEKNVMSLSLVHYKGDVCIFPPNSFALARSHRIFPHPAQCADDLLGQLRRALRLNRQRHAVRAEWEGLRHTLEISNTTPLPPKFSQRRNPARSSFFSSSPTTTAKSATKPKKANNNRRVDSVCRDSKYRGALCSTVLRRPTALGLTRARWMRFGCRLGCFLSLTPLVFPRVVFLGVSPAAVLRSRGWLSLIGDSITSKWESLAQTKHYPGCKLSIAGPATSPLTCFHDSITT